MVKSKNPDKADSIEKDFYRSDNPFSDFAKKVSTVTVSNVISQEASVTKYTKTQFVRYMRQGGLTQAGCHLLEEPHR